MLKPKSWGFFQKPSRIVEKRWFLTSLQYRERVIPDHHTGKRMPQLNHYGSLHWSKLFHMRTNKIRVKKTFLTEVQSITVALRDVLNDSSSTLMTINHRLTSIRSLTSVLRASMHRSQVMCFGSPYNGFHAKSVAYGIISTAEIWNMITQTLHVKTVWVLLLNFRYRLL